MSIKCFPSRHLNCSIGRMKTTTRGPYLQPQLYTVYMCNSTFIKNKKKFRPHVTNYKITGDGNCFFEALSLGITHHNSLFRDHFAFRPIGSTRAALIKLLHTITLLLQNHEYVHLIWLDFFKGFRLYSTYHTYQKVISISHPYLCA